jgi:hypothetical protein
VRIGTVRELSWRYLKSALPWGRGLQALRDRRSDEAREFQGAGQLDVGEALTFIQNRESEMGKDQQRIRYLGRAYRLEVVS